MWKRGNEFCTPGAGCHVRWRDLQQNKTNLDRSCLDLHFEAKPGPKKPNSLVQSVHISDTIGREHSGAQALDETLFSTHCDVRVFIPH